jgi:CheY-like chemotaxis protein
MGYTVAAEDGATAIAAVRKNNPDVIILDVSLLAGDGFVVAERLENLISTAATPIIFITASEKPGLRERPMNPGVNKPLMPQHWPMPSNRSSRRATPGGRRPARCSGHGAAHPNRPTPFKRTVPCLHKSKHRQPLPGSFDTDGSPRAIQHSSGR